MITILMSMIKLKIYELNIRFWKYLISYYRADSSTVGTGIIE